MIGRESARGRETERPNPPRQNNQRFSLDRTAHLTPSSGRCRPRPPLNPSRTLPAQAGNSIATEHHRRSGEQEVYGHKGLAVRL
eukprot:3229585-Pleurochrysis_carterae.AAC.1